MKKIELMIKHYNFFQTEENKVTKISQIPADKLEYLALIDHNTLVRPYLFILSKRRIPANAIASRFKVNRKGITKFRRKAGV